MTETERILTYLDDILTTSVKIGQFIDGLTYDEFQQDEKTIFAVVRALEIIGEAATKLPESFRETQADVPWRSMSGMRNKLIHNYAVINPLVVWKTAIEDIPKLSPKLERIMASLQ
ncbi:MAG: DUF86 domain-containing protein [Chloroflexi bacterium]|nr:DUF86 domain-containing protein [Chloroflexota bacterium]